MIRSSHSRTLTYLSSPEATPRSLMLLLTFFSALGCGPSSGEEEPTSDSWQGTTVQVGDTLTVRTTAGSVWPGRSRLVEEVAIGTETRGENDLLGRVVAIDATDDRIFIADRVFVMVRVYDMSGNHIKNIGRHGGGPGEFYSITDLGIDPAKGHLIVREGSGVLHRFTYSGEFVQRIVPHGLQGSQSGASLMLRVTWDGTTVVPHFSHRREPETPLGYISTQTLHTIDSAGNLLESRSLPDYGKEIFILQASVNREAYKPLPVPWGPQEVWSLGWDGALITGHSSEYRFEIRYSDGRRTVFEREAEPVQVSSGEKGWARERVYAIMRKANPGWAWRGPAIPDTKPWYAAIIPDRSGRLWVLREGGARPLEDGGDESESAEGKGESGWETEAWFEVFEEATGRYLGRVDVPPGFSPEPEPFIEGNALICLTQDEVGRPIVRRYRLVPPGTDAELAGAPGEVPT